MLVISGFGPAPTLATRGLGPSFAMFGEPGFTVPVDPGTPQFVVRARLSAFCATVGLPFNLGVLTVSPNSFKVETPEVAFTVSAGLAKFVVPSREPGKDKKAR